MKWILLAIAAVLSLASFALAAPQDWKSDTSYASPGHSLKSARESLAEGYYAGAVADLATLVQRVPPDAEVYFLLGAAHWGNGNREEAHKALETALAMDPRMGERLGEYPLGPGTAGRISPRGQSQAVPPKSSTPVTAPASARVAPPAAAAPPQTQAGATPPIGSAEYFLKYARLHLENGDGPAAAKYAREALKAEPGHREAQALLGRALRAGPAKPRTCQQQWSSCWVTAREFSDKNMCTQRRLACEANAR